MKRAELKRKTPLRSTSTLSPGSGFKPPTKPMARGTSRMKASKPVKRSAPKNAPTAAEGRYMGQVAALGCALCRRLGYGPTPAEVHHPRRGTGAGRASHYDTIPLCPEHHRGNTGIHGMGTKAWMAHYDLSEADLTAETRALLAAYLPDQERQSKLVARLE